MKLKELGEFGIIERISGKIDVDCSVVKGIGDDAAVIDLKRNGFLLFASDMMIEGVHFDLRKCTLFHIGWKALGINISDIAAMGGFPEYAVVSLGLPEKLNVRSLEAVYSGIRKLAEKFGVNIVGGDTNSSDKLIIDVAVIGRAKKEELVFRKEAKAGDIIMVTGALGGSMEGRHLRFTPRLKESQFLVRHFKINSMIDISDGLSGDLTHICRESSRGAVIYESLIPLSKEASSVKNALNDGEDFELLFTVSKSISRDLIKNFRKRFKTPITVIGEITKRGRGIKIIDRFGRASMLKDRGFRHF